MKSCTQGSPCNYKVSTGTSIGSACNYDGYCDYQLPKDSRKIEDK